MVLPYLRGYQQLRPFFSLHASFIANFIYLTSDSKALGSHGFVSGSMQGVNVVVRTTVLNKNKIGHHVVC